MNNGDGQNNPNFPIDDLSLVGPNPVVTPEKYANDMQRVQQLKSYLASYEERLATGYAKYRELEERQRLEETVRQGQLAARLLAEREAARAAGPAPTPASAGPSNIPQASTFTSQFPVQAAANYNEVPSSARIVEVPSSQESPQVSTTIDCGRPEVQPPLGLVPDCLLIMRPTLPQVNLEFLLLHITPRKAIRSRLSQRRTGHCMEPHPPSCMMSSGRHRKLRITDQHITPESKSRLRLSHHLPLDQRHNHIMQAHNRQIEDPKGSTSRLGHPSLLGRPLLLRPHRHGWMRYAIPEAQIVMQQTLRALQRMQTGRVKTSAEIVAEGKLRVSIVKNAEVIADYLKTYPESEVKDVFRKYLILASRQQQAAARPDQSQSSNVEMAPPRPPQQPVPSTSTATPQSAPPPQPNGVNAPPPATVHPTVPQSAVNPSSSSTPAAAAPALPTTVSIPAASTTAAPSTSNANPTSGQFTQMSWYTPRDATAPVMVRNAKGQIQWIHRQTLAQPAAPSAPSKPPVPSTPPASKTAPQPELSATPQQRPASQTAAWTPEKADRSRLAQDIMRSLGRPKGAFGAPLSPTDTISAPRFEVIHPPTVTATPTATATAKRKASTSLARSSPVSPTVVKRPRLDGQQDEQTLGVAPAVAGASDATATATAAAAAAEVAVPGVASEPEAEPSVAVVASELAVKREAEEDGHMDHVEAATLPPPDVGVDVPDHDLVPGLNDADTVRGVSVTSSEAANIERVLDVTISEPEPGLIEDDVPPRDARGGSESSADFAPPVYFDGGRQAQDGAGTLHATSSPLQGFSAAASNATPPPSSPVPSPREKGKEKEKVPLFLPSPSGSPGPSVHDEDAQSDASVAPRLPGSRKGKGKGRALDADLDLIQLADEDEASEVSSTIPRKRRRTNRAYILAPPLPEYAASLRGNEIVWWGSQSPSSSVASGSRDGTPSATSASKRASPAEEDELGDELAELRGRSLFTGECVCDKNVNQGPRVAADEEVGPVAESEPDSDSEEAETAAELAFIRLRETRCLWDGCGVVLNSMKTLQKHIVLHADEGGEWGSFPCRWKSCLSPHFKDEQSLARHLQKHARSPLLCAYEGCDRSFASASDLLHHHQSSKHRDGQLRKSCCPAPPPENKRQLSPLPGVLPAYMFAVRPVRRHPISRDRHQWVGPKVLENITSFKYTGRRSHAGQPSRLSRRLAEKVVAVELASVTPESGHAQIRRWIDDEYLDFADGYDASRRYRLWCADIPAGEVTQMVHDGLALFVDGDERGDTGREVQGGAADGSADAETDGGLGGGGGQEPGAGDEEGAAAAEEESPPPPRGGEDNPARTNAGGQGPTIRPKLTLPRRTNVIRLPTRPNRTEAVLNRDGDADAVAGNDVLAASPDQLDGSKTPPPATQTPVRPTSTPQLPEPSDAGSPQHLASVPAPSTDEVLGSVWTVWPPAKEESVETH
ncbi:hypothetical protein V8D89_003786 [Ganoderma adspersum]